MTLLMKVLANSNTRGVSQNRCFVAAAAKAIYFHDVNCTSLYITKYATSFLFYSFLSHIFVTVWRKYCPKAATAATAFQFPKK